MANESDLKRYYDERYAADGVATARPPEAYQIYLDYLEVEPGKSLLDVACGTGLLLKTAAGRGLRTAGVDISEEAIKVAGRTSPGSHLQAASGESLPFADGEFDYLTCLGSLEHFIDQDNGVREFIRVTKPDAKLCIMVPNSQYWVWKLQREAGTEQQAVQERLLTYSEWKSLLERNSLKVMNVYKDEWPARERRVFQSMNPMRMVKRAVFQAMWRLMPIQYSYQFIFICEKEDAQPGERSRHRTS